MQLLHKFAGGGDSADTGGGGSVRGGLSGIDSNPLRIFIPDNKEQAADLAKSHKRVAAFVDSSVRNDLVGIGV